LRVEVPWPTIQATRAALRTAMCMQVSLLTMTSPQVMQGRRAADAAALLGLGAARLDSEFDSTDEL
jgi:hypothetical protein